MQRLLRASLWLLFFLALSAPALAQGTTDAQLAAHYYREGDFDKAVIYYERLYQSKPSDENYSYYLACLIALKDWREAEKLAIKQSRLQPGLYRYQVDIGRVYLVAGEPEKASKEFDKLVKSTSKASVNQILELGKAFQEINENDRSLEVYYNARKQMGKSYPFHFQIAEVLGQKGDVAGMINEYLDVLTVSEGYLQSVQNTLNRIIGFDESNKYNNVLEEQLMIRVQKNPEDDIYAQMLIWMLTKQNKFQAALAQVIALDKRNREDGERVLNLSKAAMNSYNYDVAIKGYDYVKSKGESNYYFSDASIGYLKALNTKVTSGNYDQPSINQLVVAYEQALEKFGRLSSSWVIRKDLAHIKAFYQSRYEPAAANASIVLLKESIELPGLSPQQLAELKIELGDIYVLVGYIWDASLLFGQVEKSFKYDEIGFEAKLKNAKVFYYSGDFGWSQAQLEVLKGSTSKLIANDALELSVFIQENTGLDTTTEALSAFARSELMLAQHKYDSSLFLLDLIESNFPGHALADNILYQRGVIAAKQGDFLAAATFFSSVQSKYPTDILADNALMEAARTYEGPLAQPARAMEIYEQILTEYPSSLFVIEARKRFRNLRGDLIP